MQRDISREATAWLVQLDDDPHNKALRLQFIDWLATSPAHMAAWEETERVSGLMAAAGPLHAGAAKVTSYRGTWSPKSVHYKAISALALTACLAWLVVPDLSLRIQSDEVTQTAELRVVRLTDGSTVHLAPATAIAFTDGAKSRTLGHVPINWIPKRVKI